MKYSITLSREAEDESEETLVSRYISADEVIDLMIKINELDDIYEDEEENVQDELAEETTVDDTPEPPRPSRTGRGTTYNKDELIADIKAGKLSTAEIAGKHQVTTATVYQAKHKLNKASEIVEDAPGETEYARKQRERAENPGPEVNVEGEIRLAAIQGFSLSEISDMYPTVPLEEISKIKASAKY
jgi:transposase-like protein